MQNAWYSSLEYLKREIKNSCLNFHSKLYLLGNNSQSSKGFWYKLIPNARLALGIDYDQVYNNVGVRDILVRNRIRTSD